MPPIRTIPAAVKPARTERTHEENQERAYIAASRRSDRSLEARVESARRASEIHKKRTGRSLRVREEDVMNEEMYEEEDDDLPNQYRRINALNPGLGLQYNLNDRLNSYVAGQIGVRNYLHQAIFSANQHRYNNQMFGSPIMQQGGVSPSALSPQPMHGFNPESSWPMMNGMQGMTPALHNRAASLATPQEALNYQQRPTPVRSDSVTGGDDRRMSMPTQATRPTLAPSPAATHPRSNSGSQPPTPYSSGPPAPEQSPKQAPTPPQTDNASPPGSLYPLTTKLPVETQQIIDGSQYMNVLSPSQLNLGVPMPSTTKYSYRPNGGSRECSDPSTAPQTYTGLDQTLTPFPFSSQPMTMPEPLSAMSAPAKLDFGFDERFTSLGDLDDFGMFANNNTSGQITPASNLDLNWDGGDFFNYQEATG